MNEKINQIIQGFNEAYNRINEIRAYINIFNLYEEKLKREFRRTEMYVSDEEYDSNLAIINTIDLMELEKIIKEHIEKFKKIDNLNDTSEQYATFIINELTNYNWNSMPYISRYNIQKITNFENKILKDKGNIYTKEDNECVQYLYYMLTNYCFTYLKIIYDKITSIEIFKKVSSIKNNIVMIGANGSGKSTFARNLKGKTNNNITIIPAQHLLVVNKFDTIPIKENMIEKVNQYQQKNKLGSDDNIVSLLSSDFEDLIKALLIEKAEASLEYYDTDKKRISVLNKVIDIWNELLIHRKVVNPTNYSLKVEILDNQKTYDFNLLSDGEKAIFYYIAHVLLAKKESYIIIDEPENHINLSICSRLWNRLETERKDCKFIYLTHNIDFAISRSDTTLIWNQEFIPPSSWKFEIIENTFNLPDKLLMELLGSRNDIIFCEGNDKTSYDFKLYTILFPEYTVIPVGGHLNVINYCKAYNSKNQILKNKAIGIIDGDCHEDMQIKKWKKDGIYTLKINEIENLLCDNLILENVKIRFALEDEQIKKFKTLVLIRLNASKQMQATWFVKTKINNMIKNDFLKEDEDITKLKSELEKICKKEYIDQIYNDRIKEIDAIISENDYEKAIRIIDDKQNLLELADKELERDYKRKIFKIIMQDNELQTKIKDKYFWNIITKKYNSNEE